MHRNSQERIFLKDYCVPDFLVPNVDLEFDLDESETQVSAKMRIIRNGNHKRPLVLNGENLKLLSVKINNQTVEANTYKSIDSTLVLDTEENSFDIEIKNTISPISNSALSGLYASSQILCTQCEPEGFRRITYFIDRPDILSIFRVTLRGKKDQYPILLSNGNQIFSKETGAYHECIWEDPYPKPCYLFALVAGDLENIEDSFITSSGRPVTLRIYASKRDIEQCHYALRALEEAMLWDEKTYGLEYDLDQYNIVAVEDFNMGAMENKGLNIFNTRYVLALPNTATDGDYRSIKDVIGHEYFHNWSGNRVTLRDWFQLSLKEGFTVFREQQFSADHGSPGVKRIHDANLIRTQQFKEDAGPMSHPVRPESFVEINNFYTLTVYIKGAEVVRMLNLLVGEENFLKGCKKYFELNDNKAVTTEEFLAAISSVSGEDLSQFSLWYKQSGTPCVTVTGHFDSLNSQYNLHIKQENLDKSQSKQAPLQIPILTALFDNQGNKIISTFGSNNDARHEHTLILEASEQNFTFNGVNQKAIPSILRGFSAPVSLKTNHTKSDLSILMGNDNDPYNRWDAGQQLAKTEILRFIDGTEPNTLCMNFSIAFGQILNGNFSDLEFQAQALELPSETYLADFVAEVDPDKIHKSRNFVARSLANKYKADFLKHYHDLNESTYQVSSAKYSGHRALKNICLYYLLLLDEVHFLDLALTQVKLSENMTDSIAALSLLANYSCNQKDEAIEFFYNKWCDFPLIMDKWLRCQAISLCSKTIDIVSELTKHGCYQNDNPNKVYALIGSFAQSNQLRFHQKDGQGYRLVTREIIATDIKNPQVAARIATAFNLWNRFEPIRQNKMREAIEEIGAHSQLSRDLGEIIDNALNR